MSDRQPCIDLNFTAWHRTVGEYTVAGTWYRHENGDSEPCLFIHPSHAYVGRPAVIRLSDAYKFVNPREAARQVRSFALGMGKESLMQAHRLADLINDHLSDLISMKPDPRKREAVADVTVRFGDGRTKSVELLQ